MVWDREHHEVLDPETLPWDLLAMEPESLQMRVLSCDESDGAVTAQIKVPAGWVHDGTWALSTSFDAFVLDGTINLGDQRFERHDYTYRPAATPMAASCQRRAGCCW